MQSQACLNYAKAHPIFCKYIINYIFVSPNQLSNNYRSTEKMDFQEKLSTRVHLEDIHEILLYVEGNEQRKQELYELIYHKDDTLAYQTLWVLTHFNRQENEWLFARQNELISGVLICEHPGKRRLFLNLLLKQPLATPPRVDFLDFCLERMLSKEELPGVQSLCMKLAYTLCRPIPELLQEYRVLLDLMEPNLLTPAIRAARRNILKKII